MFLKFLSRNAKNISLKFFLPFPKQKQNKQNILLFERKKKTFSLFQRKNCLKPIWSQLLTNKINLSIVTNKDSSRAHWQFQSLTTNNCSTTWGLSHGSYCQRECSLFLIFSLVALSINVDLNWMFGNLANKTSRTTKPCIAFFTC